MNRSVGLFFVAGGACLVLIGLLVYWGGFNWFGKLPGDIHYKGERAEVFIPLVSMLVVSLVLSLVFYVIRRFF